MTVLRNGYSYMGVCAVKRREGREGERDGAKSASVNCD